jgi:hypothetical protein
VVSEQWSVLDTATVHCQLKFGEITRKGVQMNDASWLLYPGLFVASLIGAAVGAYFKRRAENLATHDDLDKLVEQIAAVTQTTENIKAAISDDVWDRQRQWELRRDAILKALDAFNDFESSIIDISATHRHVLKTCDLESRDKVQNQFEDASDGFLECKQKFSRAIRLIDATVGGDLSNALHVYFDLALHLVLSLCIPENDYLDSTDEKLAIMEKGREVEKAASTALKKKYAEYVPPIEDLN